MRAFYLYSTLGCHLCELAEAELLPWIARDNLEITVVDIAEEDGVEENLLALYGTRIPVLRHCLSGLELNWPFAQAELAAFFAAIARA